MRYLFVKFLRDIKKQWSQFFSVFMMAMISMTIFAGMSCVWNGMSYCRDTFFDKTNIADVWVYANGITEDDKNMIEKLSYVKDLELNMSYQMEGPTFENMDTDIVLTTLTENHSLLKPLVRGGEELEDQDGIWIDEDFANIHGIKSGDDLEITFQNQIVSMKVVGIVLDAENMFFVTTGTDSVPDHEHHGYAYINESYASKVFPFIGYNQLRLKIQGSVRKEQMREDIKDILDNRFYSLMEKNDMATISQVDDEIDQIKKMAVLFSAVFILLSLLTMYTTMKRLISNQIVQIGTMKAMGFFDRHIYIHYALYGLFVSILGGGVGILVGRIFISELVLNIKKATLTLPEWPKVLGAENFCIWGIVIAICTVSGLIAVRKVLHVEPAQTIRGLTKESSHIKQMKEKKKFNQEPKSPKCSYGLIWNFRAIMTHPTRTIMGIIAIAGSIVLMVAGIGVWDSITTAYDAVFDEEYSYEYAATIKVGMFDLVMSELNDYDTQYILTQKATFYAGDEELDGTCTIIEDGDMIHFYSQDENIEIKLPITGAVMTNKMAKMLNVKIGDHISYQIAQTAGQFSIEIKEIVNSKMPQGIFMSQEAYQDKFVPNTVYLKGEEGEKNAENCDGITGLISIDRQEENMNTMLNSVHSIMYILIFAAFLLSAVILYNLGTLSYLERSREYATMKVLGFYKKEIDKMVLGDSICNLIVGMIIGIPGSIYFLKLYVSIVSMDGVEWTPYISGIHLLLVICVIIIFTLLIHILICRKVKCIDMVEAMKAMD